MRLQGKVAIITGGGYGIGKAISLAFANEGAIVVMAARNTPKLEEAVREIKSGGGEAIAIMTDVRYEEQIERLMSQTSDRFGRIDILVNNAGIAGPTASITDMNLSEWNDVILTNLTGVMLCCREALKYMIPAKQGNIINITSEGGRSGFPMRSPYAASKRGVIALTETLAIEDGDYNIRVNCISPGRVRGERIENVARAKSKMLGLCHDEIIANLMSDACLKRLIEPSEVAAAAVFLASDEASAITGQTLPVNCGKHMQH